MRLIAFFLLLPFMCLAQEGITVAVYQDLKLMVKGDPGRNITAGTLDMVAQFKMQGNQQKYGYMVIYPEFELSNITGSYKRYCVNVGYVFNRLIITDLEASAAIGYGFIERFGGTSKSWAAAGVLAYKITPIIKINAMLQITQRTDLLWLYSANVWRCSGFMGLEIKIF